MSDFPPEIIEAAQARDRRYKTIDLGIEISAELRKGRPLHLLMERLREDADRAMEEFAQANCGDLLAIQGLQSRVFCFRYAFETFNTIVTAGQMAQREVMAEDQRDDERHYD